MIANVKNEKMKRAYIKWLYHAANKNTKTIDSLMASIYIFDDFTKHSPYHTFNKNKAVGFKKYLVSTRKERGSLAGSTIRRHLKNLQAFFQWLCIQPGFKSKLNPTDFAYLSPDNAIFLLQTFSQPKKVPSLEYVRTLVGSIKGEDEISMRDRAIISLLCLTGIRDDAAASLSLGSVDLKKLRLTQNPNSGTRTKFRKLITSYILPFDKTLLKCVEDWVKYLKEMKLFNDADPLFPATQITQRADGYTFEAKGISRTFWKTASGIRSILKDRSNAASLDYYVPHSFRSLTVQHCMKHCRTPEEFKAISQSLGHKNAMITLTSYGTLDNTRAEEVIQGIEFNQTSSPDLKEQKALMAAIRAFEREKRST